MVTVLIFLALIALAAISVFGRMPDTRDTDYALGAVLLPRIKESFPRRPEHRLAEPDGPIGGNLAVDAGPRSSVDRASAF
jgi:hypothetical protein